MSRRKIPASGINLFQLIYILLREYEEKSGQKALNLSLGNPDLIPFAEVIEKKAEMQRRPDYELHTYAEDKNLHHFCEGMIREFAGVQLKDFKGLRAVPIAGIKTATAMIPLACGFHLKKAARTDFHVVTHLPAYDVMGTWSGSYLGVNRIVWPLRSQDQMAMKMENLHEALARSGGARPDLIFVIRPGNPAARGATREEWLPLIEYCINNQVRLVNDGAYSTLSEAESHVPLAQVAKDYPDLEWAEMFSVSKSFSDPGARLGVLVGSQDFVEDFMLIKGNTDSGPVPSIMAAYGDIFSDSARTQAMLAKLRKVYRSRLDYLVPWLKKIGLKPACETTAGFFTLWQTPDEAYGLNLHAESQARGISASEFFNRLVIENSGIVGVHFDGFIRYAVCTDVLDRQFQLRFEAGIQRIEPKYLTIS